jgi:hypothetical protein
MPTGFIYVMTTVTKDYEQASFCNVPAQWKDRLYFGPCKRPMRPRMTMGDYVFAISPSCTDRRRILFAAQIEKRLTFAQAYERFPDLRGPVGPIHVRPATKKEARFPRSTYEHIPGAIHPEEWIRDLASPDLDAFFVCSPAQGWLNRWLGAAGPEIDDDIVAFLRACAVFGEVGLLADHSNATKENPVAHGRLYQGLHLETAEPERLVGMCDNRMRSIVLPPLLDSPCLVHSMGGGDCSEERACAPGGCA